MSNTTTSLQLMSNNTSMTNQRFSVTIRISLSILSVSPCLLFLYINIVMLYTLTCKPLFRVTPRYILFGNLLFADTIQLVISQLLYILAVAGLFVMRYICVMIVLVAVFSFSVSPLNLSLMSLERYVAICYPLRHSSIVTPSTAGIAIIVVWTLSFLNILIKLILLLVIESLPLDQVMQDFCSLNKLFHIEVSSKIDNVLHGILYTTATLIIIYSYTHMMVIAKAASSSKDLNHKARNTVLLHLVQLGLSFSSTLNAHIVAAIKSRDIDKSIPIDYILFIILNILPRCLSPLIYGLRDKMFRQILIYNLTCGLRPKVELIKISN